MPQLIQDQIREVVDALLAEDQRYSMKERREYSRKTLFRPVTLYLGRNSTEPKIAFSRDISSVGIGLVHDFDVQQGTLATLAVHRLWDEPIILRGEVRWCQAYGNGWNLSGWNILSVESS